jgi:hypothetical protein
VPDVIAEEFLFCLAERGPDGGDQRHDVDAVTVLVDHRWEPEGVISPPDRGGSDGRGLLSCVGG